MRLFVVKRDGSVEQFDTSKIARVTFAAGLDKEKCDQLGQVIEGHFQKLGQERVTSLQIRDEVLALLKQSDSYAANMFEWYEKTKEKNHD